MAAGMGSRFGGLKQLEAIGPNNETLLEYALYDAHRAGFKQFIFVIRREFEGAFDSALCSRFHHLLSYRFAYQEYRDLPEPWNAQGAERIKPWGTGHAVWSAREQIDVPFAIINADDFYGEEAFRLMASKLALLDDAEESLMVTYPLEKTLSQYGPVNRGVCSFSTRGHLAEVQEVRSIEQTENGNLTSAEGSPLTPDTPVSMNLWGFHPGIFSKLEAQLVRFLEKHGKDSETEFHLPACVDEWIQNQNHAVSPLHTAEQWLGMTYRKDKPIVQQKIRERIDSGQYPETLWQE